jgi:hypothetical protein
LIVDILLPRTKEHDSGGRNLTEQLPGEIRMLTGEKPLQHRSSLIRGVLDHFRVGLEAGDAQQAVMVGRLVFSGDSKPFVVGVKPRAVALPVACHGTSFHPFLPEVSVLEACVNGVHHQWQDRRRTEGPEKLVIVAKSFHFS